MMSATSSKPRITYATLARIRTAIQAMKEAPSVLTDEQAAAPVSARALELMLSDVYGRLAAMQSQLDSLNMRLVTTDARLRETEARLSNAVHGVGP